MKASKSKSGKAYEIISDNPKMDTSGMAGKPAPMDMYMVEFKMPPMTIGQMMEHKAMKEAKK
jgi:hypothetical protein